MHRLGNIMRKQGLNNIILLLIMFSVTTADVVAQNESQYAFDYDICAYKYDDSTAYVELAIDLQRSQVRYVQDEDGYKGGYHVAAEFTVPDSLVSQKHWLNIDTMANPEEIGSGQRLFSQNYFLLKAGSYDCQISVWDANSEDSAAVHTVVEICDFSDSRLAVSDILLASSITRANANERFSKSGYKVIPNPSGFYSIDQPLLYSYTEIYNLTESQDRASSQYEVTYHISDMDSNVVKTTGPKSRKKPGASSVDINRIPVATLLSGDYRLTIEVRDPASGETAVSEKTFHVFRAGDFRQVSEPDASELYAGWTEKQLEQEFEYTRYFNSKDERRAFGDADLAGKREFLKAFWDKHNQEHSPNADGRTFRQIYLERVANANDALKGMFREGWETDRGRVLLLYGPPDELEKNAFGFNRNSHEVWHYWNLDGRRADFIFIDKHGSGAFQLVHSTARGEIQNSDWIRDLGP
jgi:GWxTD domain-containing protein